MCEVAEGKKDTISKGMTWLKTIMQINKVDFKTKKVPLMILYLTKRDREVINYTRSHVKIKSKLTNLVKISRIEG